MKKKKSLVARLLLWAVVLAALAAFVIFIGIPLFTDEEVVETAAPAILSYEGGSKAMVMENDGLRFEMDPTTTQFTVTDKATGTVWRSNPVGTDNDPLALSAVNKSALRSTLEITYQTSSGMVPLNNAMYSVDEGVYEVVSQEDGSIRVNYTVGRVEKTYCVPMAITVDRFQKFMEAMGSKNEKKVKSNYTLYKPEELDKKSNKDEIIAMYPSVVDQPLYIMKADTSENNKKKLAEYFAAGGYTQEDFEIDSELVAGTKTKKDAVYNISVIYRLEGNDMVVEVPYDSLRYYNDYPITYVTLLPMFGAAGTEDTGYMVVPEGGGAVINYNNGKLSQNSYFANLYGWDYGTERTEAISETRADFPVFGMTRENSSFICIMEDGASWASVMADISGRGNSYNTVKARYNIIHFDQYNISAKTAQLVYMYEKEVPKVNIIQRYRFVPSSSYVDMAQAYGQYLEEKYPEMAAGAVDAEMPLLVEVVGAIDKTVVKFGLPLDSVVPVTTFDQAGKILQDVKASGAKNVNLRMSGWSNGGITQKVLSGVNVVGSMGGNGGMTKLIAAAKEAGIPLYFDGISCFAYDSNILDGFFPFSDAARFTTREQVLLYPFYEITYKPAEFRDPYYLVRPEYAQAKATTLIRELSKRNAVGVSFRDIGYLLSANYNPRETVNREQVKAMNVATLLEARSAGLKVAIRRGNDYAMPYADLVTDMDLEGLPYSILDGSVPFYQIALHGRKNYTGPAINLSGDYETQLLRSAEYGAGLAFTFMQEDAMVLQDTLHSYYYGANYDSWGKKAEEMNAGYQTAMAGLNNQRIVGHERLTEQVAVTRYENGAAVYVNYGTEAYTADGVTVAPRSYFVKGVN